MPRHDIDYKKVITVNRRAHYEYFIDEVMEAGLVLMGSEVKSLRSNGASIGDAYIDIQKGEALVLNINISRYDKASHYNHEPTRPRKLLLNKRQIRKLIGVLKVSGTTIVPLSLYFNHKNIAKLEIAVVRGKKQHDKRQAIKERDWKRAKARGDLG
jgi:SsrA-binding protein